MTLKSKLIYLIPAIISAILSQSFVFHHQESNIKSNNISIRTMNDSESRIIADIKKACLILSDKSATLASVISEFGTPAQEIPTSKISEQKTFGQETINEKYEIQPFNDDLERAYILKDTRVFFWIKSEAKILVDSLEEVFGEYSVSSPKLEERITHFSYKPVANGHQDYDIGVLHSITTGRIVSITISEKQ
jgi:hypothetical protein